LLDLEKNMKPILRVGVMNNFNQTDAEFKQLQQYDSFFNIFVNSNAFTKIKGKYPAFVTVNPYLNKFVKPRGDISVIKAARVKYVSGATPIVKKAWDDSVVWCREENIPVLVTYMRFASKKDMETFTDDQSNYEWKKNYYRQKKLKIFKDTLFHYCDLKGKGCPECRNCAKLSYGIDTDDIRNINLSSSGECPFKCPSCFAKRMTRVFGLHCDKISQNAKQRGDT